MKLLQVITHKFRKANKDAHKCSKHNNKCPTAATVEKILPNALWMIAMRSEHEKWFDLDRNSRFNQNPE